MIEKVGFTGTRQGTTEAQHRALTRLFMEMSHIELHHGDCIGADADAHELLTCPGCSRIIHPPKDPTYRAYCSGADEVLPPKDYLERNHDIVDATEILVACPRTRKEVLRSGTWATIRHARKKGRKIFLVHYDGEIEEEAEDVHA